jgi:serine/threonine-protein kinase OSR1/STK39
MGMLNHPNVVRFLCSFVVEREIWLVMPLLAGGSCADIMKRNFPQGLNDEVLIATILRDTLKGLLYFHKDGRIHRDVKVCSSSFFSNLNIFESGRKCLDIK